MRVTASMLHDFAALGLSAEQMAGVSSIIEREEEARLLKDRGAAALVRRLAAEGVSPAGIVAAFEDSKKPREYAAGERMSGGKWSRIRSDRLLPEWRR